MKFNPKPGDKIICNNGEEFVCCTLEFLEETISPGILSNKSIFGYSEKHDDWQDWDEDAFSSQKEYGIKEIIPAQQEVKQDVTEALTKQEKTYTLKLIQSLFLEIVGRYEDDDEEWNIGAVFKEAQEQLEGDYQKYLELKAKFEGKE